MLKFQNLDVDATKESKFVDLNLVTWNTTHMIGDTW